PGVRIQFSAMGLLRLSLLVVLAWLAIRLIFYYSNTTQRMSNDTHYTTLGVPETASQSQIRTAYRNLLKQIHPDTVSTLSPELRRMAEDATKEMVEAYSVLSDASKRRDYDRQLVEIRARASRSVPPSHAQNQAAHNEPVPTSQYVDPHFRERWVPSFRVK